jgi:hypothetical protein
MCKSRCERWAPARVLRDFLGEWLLWLAALVRPVGLDPIAVHYRGALASIRRLYIITVTVYIYRW